MKYPKLLCLLFTAIFFTSAFAQNALKYEKKGSGEAVILIPPLACPGSIWEPVVSELSKNFTCYTIEIPGFYGTPAENTPGFDDIPGKINDLVIKENLGKVIVIGHSFGGYLALNYTIEYPGSIDKLIIMDSYPCPQAAFNPALTAEQIKAQADQARTMLTSLNDEQFYAAQKNNLALSVSDSTDREMVFNYFKNADKQTIIEANYRMLSADLREPVKSIETPTLVLGTWIGLKQFGFTKEIVTQNFETQYANMKNVTFEIPDNSAHFIMLDDPGWLNNKIKGFLIND